MSKITNYISRFFFKGGLSEFLIPAYELTKDDQALVNAGILILSDQEATSALCPYGCGEIEEIHILRKSDGTLGRFILCHDNGVIELKPKDYQLYRLNVSALLLSGKKMKSLLLGQNEIKPKKKHRRTLVTNFMRYQQKAVSVYIEDECHRRLSSLSIADCHHVWNLPRNKTTWDKRAKMKTDKRGYSNPKAIFRSLKRHKDII